MKKVFSTTSSFFTIWVQLQSFIKLMNPLHFVLLFFVTNFDNIFFAFRWRALVCQILKNILKLHFLCWSKTLNIHNGPSVVLNTFLSTVLFSFYFTEILCIIWLQFFKKSITMSNIHDKHIDLSCSIHLST